MITDEHTLSEINADASDDYIRLRVPRVEDALFFDIETTGFRASSSHLYMIGCAFPDENKTWKVRQYMAVRPQEEGQLLRAFAELSSRFSTVIHFNGDRFDIPYMNDKYRKYGLPSPFDSMISVDLYRDFRPYRNFFGLTHMNQKSLERFLGLDREDEYDGGRLISVYHEFCGDADEDKLHLLLLHNREDVAGMFTLSRLYLYVTFLNRLAGADGKMPVSLPEETGARDETAPVHFQTGTVEHSDGTFDLLFRCDLPLKVPVRIRQNREFSAFSMADRTAALLIPVYRGDLLYFFDNYREYYYLPEEDRAIHKSVAGYVNKEFRESCRPDNCYEHVPGVFIPQPRPALYQPTFRRSYGDRTVYLRLTREMLSDPAFTDVYAANVIRSLYL